MNEYYKSQLGEVHTKKEWLDWADEFYLNIRRDNLTGFVSDEIKKPDNVWERLVKVLKLEPVSKSEYFSWSKKLC